jgi:hypothetical protein
MLMLFSLRCHLTPYADDAAAILMPRYAMLSADAAADAFASCRCHFRRQFRYEPPRRRRLLPILLSAAIDAAAAADTPPLFRHAAFRHFRLPLLPLLSLSLSLLMFR